jgi:hypothetical protein
MRSAVIKYGSPDISIDSFRDFCHANVWRSNAARVAAPQLFAIETAILR